MHGFADEGGGGADDAAPSKLRSVFREGGDKVLRRAQAHAEQAGVIAATALVRSGVLDLQPLVARQADQCGADSIVVGTPGRRGLSRVFMSNDAGCLLSAVTAPVLLVRSEDVGPDLSREEISATDSMFHSAA